MVLDFHNAQGTLDMKFVNYLNEEQSSEKYKSAVVNKIGAALKDALPYVRYSNSPYRLGLGVLASTRIYNDTPTTCPGFPGTTGIAIYVDDKEKVATVSEITSASSGMGSKMIEAMLSALPKDYIISVHHDWSSGWWDKIIKRYSDRKWEVN